MGLPNRSINVPQVAPGSINKDADKASVSGTAPRNLILRFENSKKPELDLIQYCDGRGSQPVIFRRGAAQNALSWDRSTPILCLLVLRRLCGDSRALVGSRTGSPAATLGDALYQTGGWIQTLFSEHLPERSPRTRCGKIFEGVNIHGRTKGREDRRIYINSDYLPSDCVEVFWDVNGPERITDPKVIKALLANICSSLNLDPGLLPVETPPPPKPQSGTKPQTKDTQNQKAQKISDSRGSDEPKPVHATQLRQTGTVSPQPTEPPKTPAPEAVRSVAGGKQAQEPERVLVDAAELLKLISAGGHQLPTPPQKQPEPQVPPAKVQPPQPDTSRILAEAVRDIGREFRSVLETIPKVIGATTPQPKQVQKSEGEEPSFLQVSHPEKHQQAPPIDPQLFEVQKTDGCWPDSATLMEFPDTLTDDVYPWTLKDSFEGILILGRTGSGKTSGSGASFARTFLRSGFGGLVLTVKENEAQQWARLCTECGRQEDLVIVRPGGDAKLNVIQYEAQHPRRGGGLSGNLTSFCQNLLRISARRKSVDTGDQVWVHAGEQLLNATFDLFLLSGAGMSFDYLSEFIQSVPCDTNPASEQEWLRIPVVGPTLIQASNSIKTSEDRRIYERATNYWFKIYRSLASKTRTSVTLGIYAMLDAFRGRGIHDLVSSTTTVTPESIMSGKIIVLDLPFKRFEHTGLMVQSAWKYLFQLALESQPASHNTSRRRPVFLWEDEGQYFFSDHDHKFQDTARASRVCRVILTQNLHAVYKELGSREGPDSVFANLNTKFFHNNDDPLTNNWAASLFGQELRSRASFSVGAAPQPGGLFEALKQTLVPHDNLSVQTSNHWEHAVRPEQFQELRTGDVDNDFLVEAYASWMRLSSQYGQKFIKTVFDQRPEIPNEQ